MTEFDPEIKSELLRCVEAGDIEKIHDILDALESADRPELVKVEFTRSQFKDLEMVRKNLNQPNIAAVLRMMVDSFMPGYKKAHAEAVRKARATG